MYPTFNPRGDYLLVSRLHKHGRGIEVGDVVRFYHPSFLGMHGAKRVVGLPGDFVCRDHPLSTDVGGSGEMIRVCSSSCSYVFMLRVHMLTVRVGTGRTCLRVRRQPAVVEGFEDFWPAADGVD